MEAAFHPAGVSSGFTAARVVVAPQTPPMDVDVRELRSFMGGRGFARYWRDLCAGLDGHHFILLFAGDPAPTTRRPARLSAVLHCLDPDGAVTVSANAAGRLRLDVYNAGDTRWLSAAGVT